jgi:two-component system sensor histidine kinase CreC
VSGKIAGVLTVIKPTTNIAAFVNVALPRLFKAGAISIAAAILLALLMSMWVTQQVSRLTRYADDVREGRRVPFPKLAPTELRTMGLAFEKMREALAGQAYVEQYVEALTHEIKSPISAIRGAAEILEDPSISAQQRTRFLSNIQNETKRIQELVDRMLTLTELEARRALASRIPVRIGTVVGTIVVELERYC